MMRIWLKIGNWVTTVNWRAGKQMHLSDFLSRYAMHEPPNEIPGLENAIWSIEDSIPNAVTRTETADKTMRDKPLVQVMQFIVHGWPEKRTDLGQNQELNSFYLSRNSLSISHGLILKGNRIVYPSSMRKQILGILQKVIQE